MAMLKTWDEIPGYFILLWENKKYPEDSVKSGRIGSRLNGIVFAV